MKLAMITTAILMTGMFAHAQGEPAQAPAAGSQMMEQKAETSNMKKEKKHKKHGKKAAKSEKSEKSETETK